MNTTSKIYYGLTKVAIGALPCHCKDIEQLTSNFVNLRRASHTPRSMVRERSIRRHFTLTPLSSPPPLPRHQPDMWMATITLHTGLGKLLQIKVMGTVQYQVIIDQGKLISLTIDNCYYVPDLHMHLLSMHLPFTTASHCAEHT